MITAFADDLIPSVVRHDGKIGILTPDLTEGHLISTAAAVELATKLLAAVSDVHEAQGRDITHPVEGIRFQIAQRGATFEGRLTFNVNRVPLFASLTEEQVTDLAAAFLAADRHIEAGGKRAR